jgi:hypothetical protein
MGALTIGVRMDKSIIKALSGRTIAYIILKISGAFVGSGSLQLWQHLQVSWRSQKRCLATT